jgi:demethylmenaquinone methyltransferase / 2-methoxy-6-polyprenyl-1,4-benzoquinol methylase
VNISLGFGEDEMCGTIFYYKVLEPRQQAVLDLGIGTGKFLELFARTKSWKRKVGLDFSTGMLEEARKSLAPDTRLVSADFLALPFMSESFDVVISAFTLRSVRNMPLFLSEIFRVLRPQGRTALLCLTRPKNPLWKMLYYPYLKFYLPLIGGLFSGNKEAYEFLSNSIMSFQDPEKTAAMMKQAGFTQVRTDYFSMGMATLLTGTRS